MSKTTSRVTLSIAIVMVLLLTLITKAVVNQTNAPQVRVLDVQTAITLSEKDRIGLFIDELLTAKQGTCLKSILMKESNMRSKAQSKSSSAKGVGQLLDSTYKNLGLKHSADPLAQVIATIAYVSRHYGGTNAFCNAWAFHQKHNYY